MKTKKIRLLSLAIAILILLASCSGEVPASSPLSATINTAAGHPEKLVTTVKLTWPGNSAYLKEYQAENGTSFWEKTSAADTRSLQKFNGENAVCPQENSGVTWSFNTTTKTIFRYSGVNVEAEPEGAITIEDCK